MIKVSTEDHIGNVMFANSGYTCSQLAVRSTITTLPCIPGALYDDLPGCRV